MQGEEDSKEKILSATFRSCSRVWRRISPKQARRKARRRSLLLQKKRRRGMFSDAPNWRLSCRSYAGKKMSTVGELACSYAVMILEDEGIAITADKISTLVKAAGVEIESYWPMLFAKMAEKRNVTDLILNVGAGGGGAAAATTAAPAAEEKKMEALGNKVTKMVTLFIISAKIGYI